MKTFGPGNQTPWTLYNQDGTVLREYGVGQCQNVMMLTDNAKHTGLTLPDGRLLSQQPLGRLEVRPAGSPISAYEQVVVTGQVVTFSPNTGDAGDGAGLSYRYVLSDIRNP